MKLEYIQTDVNSQEGLDRLNKIASRLPGVVYQFRMCSDGTSCFPFASEAMRDIFHLSPEEVREDASKAWDVVHPEDFASTLATTLTSARDLTPWHHEFRLKFEDGSIRWVFGNALPQREADHSTLWHGFITDVTEHKQLEESLACKEQEFRTLTENSPNTIARYNRDCQLIYANPKFIKMVGQEAFQLLGKTPEELFGSHHGEQYKKIISEVFTHSEERDFEMRGQVGPSEICTHTRMSPEFNLEGSVTSVLIVGTDITKIDEYRKRMHHQAFFDALTDLPNRALLADRTRHAMTDAAFHKHRFGLLILDLDRFKEINDTLGHGVGDILLCETARRLLSCVRSYDTVARLGGDEFAVLLPDIRNGADLGTIATKMLAILVEPFEVEGKELFVSGSIGIAIYPDDTIDMEALFKYADSAMYHAKKLGRNNFQFYAKELTVRSLEKLDLEAALRKAIHKGELELYYQPQINLRTNEIAGAEALLRWNSDKHGMVMPDKFISIAEDAGLIVEIGEWVLKAACETIVAWNTYNQAKLIMAVNLSSRQFVRNDLVGNIQHILDKTGCLPEWIKLEITESLLLENSHDVATMLESLNKMGLSISIDDFGTGYSALSYLNRFPISQIKVDRSFIRNTPIDREKTQLVKAIIAMADSLHLEVVAEGVEEVEQSDYLMAYGCWIVQGYLYGKPMQRSEFERKFLYRGLQK